MLLKIVFPPKKTENFLEVVCQNSNEYNNDILTPSTHRRPIMFFFIFARSAINSIVHNDGCLAAIQNAVIYMSFCCEAALL